MDAFYKELVADGMIDTAHYSIITGKADLYINNVKQPQNIYYKYSKYFDKTYRFSMTNSHKTIILYKDKE